MNNAQHRVAITNALNRFTDDNLAENALNLLDTLGYRSERVLALEPNTADDFIDTFDPQGQLNRDRALTTDWASIDPLFQLRGEDLTHTDTEGWLFDPSQTQVDNTIIESYVFLALRLSKNHYNRTQLSQITREINKLFPMPAMLLFQHGETLTLSIINRRLGVRDQSRDVLEKVTLIKDINFSDTHRAHIDILFDLALEPLNQTHGIRNFVELHHAWEKTLDTSELNKRFFNELANWYFWAVGQVTFPEDAGEDVEVRNATSVIRLLTRLIFVWFIKEKGLVPNKFFNPDDLNDILNNLNPQESTYYKAILQNLFFATLNTEMKPESRKFRSRTKQSKRRDQHYMVHSFYRYKGYFKKPEEALGFFEKIPFLNGGLFECLDKSAEGDSKKDIRIDGFSDRDDIPLHVPNELFFSTEQTANLNAAYGTKGKGHKVRGLIDILSSYKFTIAENTPIEEEVALDPELLGKVFENLLAAYNPETKVTARKQTGSYYTPREIVNYMTDESLVAYLKNELITHSEAQRTFSMTTPPSQLDLTGQADPVQTELGVERASLSDEQKSEIEKKLRELFAYNDEPNPFDGTDTKLLIEAIDTLKILDPAVGSGAFPMGALHRLVYILGKLDSRNEQWKQRQIDRVENTIEIAGEIDDSTIRESTIRDLEGEIESINEAFERNELDYGRKLYLIENCIYGVDIQPIATQIAKLRFFISLIVDQQIDDSRENRGVRPLPNLETKFVAANTLIGVDKPSQIQIRNPQIDRKEKELEDVRRRHFTARTPRTKAKYRALDTQIRTEIGELLRGEGFPHETTEKIAHWDPYDQNASADFFDPEWMFGLREGFDVVMANPPYVLGRETFGDKMKKYLSENYGAYGGKYDLYIYFTEKGISLLKKNGLLAYILPNTLLANVNAQNVRRIVLENTSIKIIRTFDSKVFAAQVESIVIIVKKDGNNESNQVLIKGEDDCHIPQSFFTENAEFRFNLNIDLPTANLIKKINNVSMSLGSISDICIGIQLGGGSASASKKNFISSIKKDETYKQVLDGKDINSYQTSWKGLYVRYGSWLHRKRNEKYFLNPKIIIRQIGSTPIATYDGEQFYTLNTVYNLIGLDDRYSLKYVLGIINSKLGKWFWIKNNSDFKTLFPKIKKSQIETVPIYDLDLANSDDRGKYDRIVAHVNQILSIKQAAPNIGVSELENEIDQIVYLLYDLTCEEVAIVEAANV